MPDGTAGVIRVGAATAPALHVGGLVPFTATDYPGALAAVVFCQGCPWRCPYCHNPHLLPSHRDGGEGGEYDFPRIVDWLATRRGLLDAVVFSGGEPTAQAGLADAVRVVRELGFAIGLHTGGAYPRRLAQVLPRVDWVGLDLKASIADYAGVTGVPGSGIPALASLDLVLGAGVAHEVRTTVHPGLTPPDALERLAGELAAHGVDRWVLQPFRAIGCADDDLVIAARGQSPLDEALAARLRTQVRTIEIRG